MTTDLAHHPLCRLSDLPSPGSKGIRITLNGMQCELFVVRKGDDAYAYLNSCPHTGGPLDWSPDEFLDEDNENIMCSTHAAVFRIEDGVCLAGPCAGQSLIQLDTFIKEGVVYLKTTDNIDFS